MMASANLRGWLPSATRASWLGYKAPIPKFKLVLEADTGIVRMGNGDDPYSALPPFIDQPLSREALQLLSTAGQNVPGGLVLLDVNGNYPLELLKPQLLPKTIYVRDLTERNQLDVALMENSLVVVMDTTGDPNLPDGSTAMYGYWAGAWIFLSRINLDELEVDKLLNIDNDTIDDIQDGVYIRMLFEERLHLQSIESNANRTTEFTVRESGAVMFDDRLIVGTSETASLL